MYTTGSSSLRSWQLDLLAISWQLSIAAGSFSAPPLWPILPMAPKQPSLAARGWVFKTSHGLRITGGQTKLVLPNLIGCVGKMPFHSPFIYIPTQDPYLHRSAPGLTIVTTGTGFIPPPTRGCTSNLLPVSGGFIPGCLGGQVGRPLRGLP